MELKQFLFLEENLILLSSLQALLCYSNFWSKETADYYVLNLVFTSVKHNPRQLNLGTIVKLCILLLNINIFKSNLNQLKVNFAYFKIILFK